MHVAAIIAAGGRGVRLGADRPKQFLELGGRSILDLSIDALAASGRFHEIVVAVPSDHLDATRAAWTGGGRSEGEGFSPRRPTPVTFVPGGARRQDSVANAFAHTSTAADIVVIHDAARPFVTAAVIGRTIEAAERHGAAIAAIPVRDTVKQAGADVADGSRPIIATVPRESIFLAQTPQAFRRDVLARALAAGTDVDASDEAMLVERLGLPVHVVEGDPRNVKITTQEDLAAAKAAALQSHRPAGDDVEGDGFGSDSEGDGFSRRLIRIGHGYDLHRLVAGRPLILAGVTIPFELGLDGHSDADIVCHAVTDAVLGAAAIGDIGRLFPDTDPEWKGADSVALLRGAMKHVHAAGYRVSNVDVTVIAQKPKLLPYLQGMRENLASALDVDVAAVSVKGKTNEGVDSMGRGEAMACHVVALLRS